MGNISKVFFAIFGIGGTVFMFIMHATFSNYGMNPLAFIACICPLIIALPILVFDDDDF